MLWGCGLLLSNPDHWRTYISHAQLPVKKIVEMHEHV
jgi:hypothetical protein